MIKLLFLLLPFSAYAATGTATATVCKRNFDGTITCPGGCTYKKVGDTYVCISKNN